MKAYHLTESAMPRSVAIIFGRFNPPHKGHKHAWITASENAEEWFVGTNKSTIGPDDPLPFEVKIEAMTAIMPEVADHLVAEQSWWTLATYVFKKYGGIPGRTLPIELIVITDEPYVVPGLAKSNGVPGAHGEYSFQNIRLPFDSIEQAKKHLRISSATALRNAVAAGDREGFAEAAGVPADTEVAGHKFFDLVAHYLLPHRAAQAEKDRIKAEKAAAKQEKERLKAEKHAEKAKGPAQELAERSVSQKQARFMAAAAHDPAFAKKAGIKQSVAKEFNKADTGTKQLSNAMKNKPKKKLSEIAGAFPSPSTREKWAKDAAASNAAEAKRQADIAAKAQAQRLAINTPDVERLNKVNYHGVNAPKPSNASWDGDSSFLDLDGTQYSMASRMPISGDVPPDMKLVVTKEGRQVYIWTRNSLKGVHGRYFYPAPVKEGRISQALEQIYENRHGSIQADVADALPQTFVIPKLQNQDAYHQYRFGLAVAAARGQKDRAKEHGEQFAGVSPWGENEIVITFDPNETETIDAALSLVGLSKSDKKALNHKESTEAVDVSKQSPVAKIKRNKYGV